VLSRCIRDLLTSHGVRSLAAADSRYLGHESAEPASAARAAVMGSAWTWLLPNLALAQARILGDRASALELIEPLESLMRDCGLALLPDRADGDPPHAPRGDVDGAWPVGETLRAFHALVGVRRDLRRRELSRPREAEAAEVLR
jgi:4-alpha-glucanotransferase